MCIHNDNIFCDDCCYQLGYDTATEEAPYDNDFKNWSQVNNYMDGYREGFSKNGAYWCCSAPFGNHDIWCKNYKEN